jgi:hypothetical protein
VQGYRGLVGRVFQSAGGPGLRAHAGAPGLDGQLESEMSVPSWVMKSLERPRLMNCVENAAASA